MSAEQKFRKFPELVKGIRIQFKDLNEALRAGAATVTLEDVLKGKREPIPPIVLASGFKVSMSVNDPGTGRVIEHVSVYDPKGRTDPADAERIAKAVLGEGYKVLGGGALLEENRHFIKLIKKQQEV